MKTIQEKKEELGPHYQCYLEETHVKGQYFTGLCIMCGKATIHQKDGWPLHKQLYWTKENTNRDKRIRRH